MLSLKSPNSKFEILFTIIENGGGAFKAIIDEISQSQAPSYVFSLPRRILRVNANIPLNSSMVIESPAKNKYIIGDHGDSETIEGTIFKSFRLFEVTQKYKLERRTKIIDPVTRLPRDDTKVSVMNIWGTYEPLPELFDRETRVATETARFITNHPLNRQDIIDGKPVIRVDKQLELYIATLA